jgi:hypothetical protein
MTKRELIQLAQTWFLYEPLRFPPRGPMPDVWRAREPLTPHQQKEVSMAERMMWLYLMQAIMTELQS